MIGVRVQYDEIKLTFDGPVATITLNRPDVLNAITTSMLRQLNAAVDEVGHNDKIKALVIRGEGRGFCAGVDLGFMSQLFEDPPSLRSFLKDFNGFLFKLEELPIPVICVVTGYALAGGFEFTLACDLVIATEDARIGDQHGNVGLVPGGGSSQRLPRRIGYQRASELLLTGRWVSGKEAEKWDLITRAVSADTLDDELDKLLSSLRDKSRPGLGVIKKLLLQGRDIPLKAGIDKEIEAFVQHVITSPHPKEGIQAFKEKRQPKF